MTRRVLGVAVLLIAFCGVVAAQVDLESTLGLLKGAEAQNDVAQIKALAVKCITEGRKDLAAAGSDKDRNDFDKSVVEYGEYALLNAATKAPDAAKIDLLSTLEQNSPKSKYLEAAYPVYFQAMTATGAQAKIPEIAQKALANFPDSIDLLSLCLNDAASKQQSANILTYSNRLIAAVPKAAKPEGVADADWEKKKTALLGPAYFYSGALQYQGGQVIQADRALRAALPLVRGNDAMYGQALFLLGGANFRIGQQTASKAKILEAAKFCSDAARVNFPAAQEAARQAQLMTVEAAKYR